MIVVVLVVQSRPLMAMRYLYFSQTNKEVDMRFKTKISALISALVLGMSGNAMACEGDFYVVWMDADSSVGIQVRSTLVNAAGTSDRHGNVTLPDSALGGQNPIYQFNMLNQAFLDNTKVRIITDDTDCVISSAGENLGTITDVDSADF